MDGKAIQRIRDLLTSRWERIGHAQRSRERQNQQAAELTPPSAELIDIAQNLEQLGRDASLAEQERRERAAIERALAKMAIGSFGACEECGEEIPFKRLCVLPEARLCAHCQAFEERKNARIRPSGSLAQ